MPRASFNTRDDSVLGTRPPTNATFPHSVAWNTRQPVPSAIQNFENQPQYVEERA